MRFSLTATILLLLGCFTLQLPAQDIGEAKPKLSPTTVKVLERLEWFPPEEQARIAKRAWLEALQQENVRLQALQELEDWSKRAKLPTLEANPNLAWDANTYAPALKLKTRILGPKSTTWKKAKKKFFSAEDLPQRELRWEYDFGNNALRKPLTPPTPAQLLTELLEGEWPKDGRVGSLAVARIDDQNKRDPQAFYFANHYRDRDGRIYSGIRLSDVWDSGAEFEVSDAEAIAWLRTVGKDNSYQSPISASDHDPIYARIESSFQDWREYQSLRIAIASRLDSTLSLPWRYTGLEKVLDRAWGLMEWSPDRMRKLISQCETREVFFERIQKLWEKEGIEPEVPEYPFELIQEATRRVLREEGLLGLGRR
ncbi:MAG: hypothetical protein QF389_01355 [Planctomycetota bacterium]|jgi:hypothetical protein|nr:hypothetical protein [Planctomycetota bacterium]